MSQPELEHSLHCGRHSKTESNQEAALIVIIETEQKLHLLDSIVIVARIINDGHP
jgi:hypothetical protein